LCALQICYHLKPPSESRSTAAARDLSVRRFAAIWEGQLTTIPATFTDGIVNSGRFTGPNVKFFTPAWPSTLIRIGASPDTAIVRSACPAPAARTVRGRYD